MAKITKNDDLFADSTMTFGEHLEELRVALFRSVLGLVIGFIIGLFIAEHVVAFIKAPLAAALSDYYLDSAMEKLDEDYQNNPPPEQVAVIRDRGLIPEDAFVEPSALVETVREAFPDQWNDVRINPHIFALQDVPRSAVAELSQRLLEFRCGDDTTPLAELLPEEDREALQQMAQSTTIQSSTHGQLVKILNRLVNNPKLHGGSCFAALADEISDTRLAEAIRRLRGSGDATGDPDVSRRINRLLLNGAFADLLPPVQAQLTKITLWKPSNARIQTLGVHEGFMILIKSAVVSGLVISSPWVFYHLWIFVAAGLYPHEKHFVHIFLPFSLGLFLAGASLAFFFVFQPVLDFLLGFNRLFNISAEPRMSDWLSFVMFMPLGFGISFQLPLVMLFMHRVGIFDVSAYLEKWRIAVLCIFVIAMFLTPADPVSMLLMAVPLTILYFGGVLLCLWMPRRSSPISGGYEP